MALEYSNITDRRNRRRRGRPTTVRHDGQIPTSDPPESEAPRGWLPLGINLERAAALPADAGRTTFEFAVATYRTLQGETEFDRLLATYFDDPIVGSVVVEFFAVEHPKPVEDLLSLASVVNSIAPPLELSPTTSARARLRAALLRDVTGIGASKTIARSATECGDLPGDEQAQANGRAVPPQHR